MPEMISPLEIADEATGQENEQEREVVAPDLGAVRDLVLRAHPDVVPELVMGDSLADLLASVEPARSAYARLAESWAERRPASTTAPVPAGGGMPIAVDPDRLPAAEKIRVGLATSRNRKG